MTVLNHKSCCSLACVFLMKYARKSMDSAKTCRWRSVEIRFIVTLKVAAVRNLLVVLVNRDWLLRCSCNTWKFSQFSTFVPPFSNSRSGRYMLICIFNNGKSGPNIHLVLIPRSVFETSNHFKQGWFVPSSFCYTPIGHNIVTSERWSENTDNISSLIKYHNTYNYLSVGEIYYTACQYYILKDWSTS